MSGLNTVTRADNITPDKRENIEDTAIHVRFRREMRKDCGALPADDRFELFEITNVRFIEHIPAADIA